MKLGLTLGYWGQMQPPNMVEAAVEAEKLGFDSVWTAESWGSDAFSPLAWIGAHTSTIRLGTGVVQLAARTPVATAMHAVTIDHLTNGRLILGLGVSGPQVVEGWYGQPYRKPLARTREYVDIIRQVLRREGPLEYAGQFNQHPYTGEGSMGLGKPLKIMTHPLREDIPIFLGAEGPKNVTMTAEIADGWLPLYYSPFRQDVYAEQIAGRSDDFEINALAQVIVTEDSEEAISAALMGTKMMLAFYIGGMGAKGANFHTNLMARMGFEEQAFKIQDLFLEDKRDEAVQVVPDEFADEIALVGPAERIKDRLAAWEDSPVTSLMVGGTDLDKLRQTAEVILG